MDDQIIIFRALFDYRPRGEKDPVADLRPQRIRRRLDGLQVDELILADVDMVGARQVALELVHHLALHARALSSRLSA